jgi:NADH:ubiquinone oxidoreductase subunit D/NADH:ubiquinone oxidoreductase subunit C
MSGGQVVAALDAAFPGQIEQGPTALVIATESLPGVLTFLRRDMQPPFEVLVDLLAVDNLELAKQARYTAHYCLRRRESDLLLRLEVSCSGASLPSATGVWPAAAWFEREVYDLMGIEFVGHADLRRILLPEDYVHHPLRKDYPLRGLGEREAPLAEATAPTASAEPLSAEGEVAILDFNPLYPGQGLRLVLEVEGERVLDATPDPGYAHAGLEKLGESLTYAQCPQLAGRLGEQVLLSGELALVLAVEGLLDLQVPPRARHVRVLWSELARVGAHLAWLGEQARLAGSPAAFHRAWAERDKIVTLFAALDQGSEAGLLCVGGAVADMSVTFADAVVQFCRGAPAFLDEMDALFTGHPTWVRRVRGLGLLNGEAALAWGASGPVLRGAGIAQDVRRSDPYSGYENFEFSVPVGEYGDVYDRCQVRLEEIAQSVRIATQALEGLPEGAHRVEDVKLVGGDVASPEGLVHHFAAWMEGHGMHPPLGDAYQSVEAPGGELGLYLASDGTDRPYRLRFRTPSFAHLQCFAHLVSGLDMDEVALVLGSLNIAAAEVDR